MHTEIAVIGGGPAGLQAALTIGRVHRDVVLFDDGTYRNARVSHMHNVVSHDGTPPADFRADARRQLTAYDTVTVRDQRVESVEEVDGLFHLRVADGTTLTAYAVVLATGVRDTLPPVPGIDDLWGDLVAHCPFCHGHELHGRRVAILGAANAPHLGSLLGRIASELLVLTDGDPVPDGLPANAVVRTERVVGVERHAGGLRLALDGADGRSSARGRRRALRPAGAEPVGALRCAAGSRAQPLRRGPGRRVRPHEPRPRLLRRRHGAPAGLPDAHGVRRDRGRRGPARSLRRDHVAARLLTPRPGRGPAVRHTLDGSPTTPGVIPP